MKEEERILMEIGHYFLGEELKTKSTDEAFIDTYNFLNAVNITDIKVIGKNKYEITLCRPGLFIGSKGRTIDGISEKLGIKIELKENKLAGLVYPLDYRNY